MRSGRLKRDSRYHYMWKEHSPWSALHQTLVQQDGAQEAAQCRPWGSLMVRTGKPERDSGFDEDMAATAAVLLCLRAL